MCKAINIIEQLINSIKETDEEYAKLNKELSRLDMMQQDVLHLIESDIKFNAAEGYFYAKKLQEIRIARRLIKNELQPIISLRSSMFKYRTEFGKIESKVKNMDSKLQYLSDNKIYNNKVLSAVV